MKKDGLARDGTGIPGRCRELIRGSYAQCMQAARRAKESGIYKDVQLCLFYNGDHGRKIYTVWVTTGSQPG